MPQVRAWASWFLVGTPKLHTSSVPDNDDSAASLALSADIKRFLERPMEPIKTPTTYDAPPGAPIGDEPMDWLASPPWSIRVGSIADWRLQIED